MTDWLPIIRYAIFVSITIAGLYIMSHLFGTHFLKNLYEGAKKEFTTKMGICSLIGFLAFLYFALEIESFKHLTLLFTPKAEIQNMQQSLNHNTDNTIIWALVVVLLGNFTLIGIISKNNSQE